MKIYNTLTRKKETFEPRNPTSKKVQMFVCGPTVYNYIHMGNARTFVFFDVVAKYLKHKGYEVNYIQNITDIDNKIIEQAQQEGIDSLEYAKKYSNIFKEDIKALGVTSPEYKNATDHIPEVIKQVQILLDKGNAYIIKNDGIYFDLSTFPDYGKLSGRAASMADDAVSRIDDSNKKRNRGDFTLWKFSQHNDPSWPAPFGNGRPGWHIEDTAITDKYFGSQYDIHGGGQDLIFPHHEAEITQQESISGLKPFVKYWMHGGFLVNKTEKMSKSIGNFETANEILKKYPKEVLRFYLLSNHYRSSLDFNESILRQSEAGVNRIYEFIQKLKLSSGKDAIDLEKIILKNTEQKFFESMDNDFNIPEAFGNIFEMIKNINPLLTLNRISRKSAEKVLNLLNKADLVLGIISLQNKEFPTEIKELANKREKSRENNNYEEADKIRAQIEELGYQVEDTVYGTLISKK